MPPSSVRHIQASTLQVILNQILGGLIFLLTSIYLPKAVYGELNWTTALLAFLTGTISLRLEQVVVRRTAAGEDASAILSLFMMHVLLTGTGLSLVLISLHFIFPQFFSLHQLLFWVMASQLLQYLALPFRPVANGKERFGLLALISSISNGIRALGLICFILLHQFTIENVLTLFIAGAAAEWLVSYFMIRYQMGIAFSFFTNLTAYKQFIRENKAQLGSALLMAGITRMDWILMGIISTSALTAEYSFAYRVYELSPLPLLILAPILLSRFSSLLKNENEQRLMEQKEKWERLIRLEMAVAVFIPMLMALVWSPLLDALTHGKYGSSNQWIFIILCLALPFQYISNLCWSLHFAQNRQSLIFRITLISFLIIFSGDLLAIPRFGAMGAAMVYLLAMITEYVNYLRNSAFRRFAAAQYALFGQLALAGICGWIALQNNLHYLWRMPIAALLFFLLNRATGLLRKSDLQFVFQAISRKKSKTEERIYTP